MAGNDDSGDDAGKELPIVQVDDEEDGSWEFHQACPACGSTMLYLAKLPVLGGSGNDQCWILSFECRSCGQLFELYLIWVFDGLIFRWFERYGDDDA